MVDGRIRVVTYNVRSLRDDRDGVVRLLRLLRPDVACLQEAPRRFRWRYHCARLAADAGLLYVAGGGTTGGTMLLSRLSIDVRNAIERMLTKTAGLHQRGIAAAVMQMSGREFVAASIHLGLDGAERLRHLDEIRSIMSKFGSSPAIIAGDVNESPGKPAWHGLASDLNDTLPDGPPTFPAVRPRRRIDGVFVSEQFEVQRAEVVDHPDVLIASDHRPVVADLILND